MIFATRCDAIVNNEGFVNVHSVSLKVVVENQGQ